MQKDGHSSLSFAVNGVRLISELFVRRRKADRWRIAFAMGDKNPSGNNAWNWGQGSGYRDGIFYSKRPDEPIPNDPYLDFTTHTLRSGKCADRVALIDASTEKSLTYGDLIQQVKAVASGLAEIGVKQGDVVMIVLPSLIQYPVLLLAVGSIGAVVTAVNPLNTTREIVRQVRKRACPFHFNCASISGPVPWPVLFQSDGSKKVCLDSKSSFTYYSFVWRFGLL